MRLRGGGGHLGLYMVKNGVSTALHATAAAQPRGFGVHEGDVDDPESPGETIGTRTHSHQELPNGKRSGFEELQADTSWVRSSEQDSTMQVFAM